MSDLLKQPIRGNKFVDPDGTLTQRNLELLQLLVQLQILEGSGSPEGVTEAKRRTLYMNTAGTSGNILYIKRDADVGGDRRLGWILV